MTEIDNLKKELAAITKERDALKDALLDLRENHGCSCRKSDLCPRCKLAFDEAGELLFDTREKNTDV